MAILRFERVQVLGPNTGGCVAIGIALTIVAGCQIGIVWGFLSVHINGCYGLGAVVDFALDVRRNLHSQHRPLVGHMVYMDLGRRRRGHRALVRVAIRTHYSSRNGGFQLPLPFLASRRGGRVVVRLRIVVFVVGIVANVAHEWSTSNMLFFLVVTIVFRRLGLVLGVDMLVCFQKLVCVNAAVFVHFGVVSKDDDREINLAQNRQFMSFFEETCLPFDKRHRAVSLVRDWLDFNLSASHFQSD